MKTRKGFSCKPCKISGMTFEQKEGHSSCVESLPTYTTEQKKAFLEHATLINEHMRAILELPLHIINDIGLEAYPFDKSFDELQLNVSEWVNKIEEEIKAEKIA